MQRVRVYRNLNNGMLSVQHKMPQGWRLSHYVDAITLADCRMVVSASGHRRAVAERTRNVHAFVEGVVITDATPMLPTAARLRYNPFEAAHFFDAATGAPVTSAQRVHIVSHGKGAACPIMAEV